MHDLSAEFDLVEILVDQVTELRYFIVQECDASFFQESHLFTNHRDVIIFQILNQESQAC